MNVFAWKSLLWNIRCKFQNFSIGKSREFWVSSRWLRKSIWHMEKSHKLKKNRQKLTKHELDEEIMKGKGRLFREKEFLCKNRKICLQQEKNNELLNLSNSLIDNRTEFKFVGKIWWKIWNSSSMLLWPSDLSLKSRFRWNFQSFLIVLYFRQSKEKIRNWELKKEEKDYEVFLRFPQHQAFHLLRSK